MKFYFLPSLGSQAGLWLPGGKLSRQYLGTIGKATSPFPRDYHIGNWMDDEVQGTEGYHPHVLLSYYWFRDKALQFPSESFVFGDSGGFSVLSKGMYRPVGPPRHQRWVDPVDVLYWQAKCCTVGAILDVPPVTPAGKPISMWDKGLQGTLRNTRRALSTYETLRAQGTKFRWWGVVHGWAEDHLNHWWREISGVYPFTEEGEGWAIRARPTSFDPQAIGRCLYWMNKRKIQRVHFLAAAGADAIATIIVLGAKAGIQQASCDSKASLDFARHRKIFLLNEDGLGTGSLTETGTERLCRDHMLVKCQCASCNQLREDVKHYPDIETTDEYEGKFGAYWLHRHLFHNHIMLVAVVRNIEREASKNPDALLLSILGKNKYGPTLQALAGQGGQVAQGFPRSLLDFA